MALLDTGEAFESSDRVWLNTAHQGALPLPAARSLHAALSWKLQPHRLQAGLFRDVPARLRKDLSALMGADEDDVVLANSASYGLHLLANGLPWKDGDEVVVAANDFPSNVLPWISLRDRGVKVTMVEPADEVLTPAEVRARLGSRTKVVCLTWVHSFSGRVADLAGIGEVAQANGTYFVVNASQGLGALPLDVASLPVDALVSVGFKWLCGPYGTGVCWLTPAIRNQIGHLKRYWLQAITPQDLADGRLDLERVEPPDRGRLDVFGTANFFNFVPFAAAVAFLLDLGLSAVARHDQALVDRLLADLDRRRFRLVSSEANNRSSLVVVKPTREDAGAVVERLRRCRIDVAHRAGRVRLSPHVHNRADDIDATLDAL